jgi:predicted nucleic acid-binding protein
MSTAALLCDTGALLDYLVAAAPDHRAFRDAIDRSRTRYIPGLVLAEVDYFLRKERAAMGALIRDLSRGAFTYAAPTQAILDRAMDVDRQYDDLGLGLGLVDSSVVALAEELGVYRLATRDVRHFSAVRLRGGKCFELVVQPRRPERGGA